MKKNILIFGLVAVIIWLIAGRVTYNSIKEPTQKKIEKKRVRKKKREKLPLLTMRRTSTIAVDANNPGCIRPGNPDIDELADGYIMTVNGRFLRFGSIQDGAYAIQLWKMQRPEWSLNKAINAYAPNVENNTGKYIQDICKLLDVNPSTKLKDINDMAFISTIAKIEGGK